MGRGQVYTQTLTGYTEVSEVARPYGKLFGLVPYDFGYPSIGRARHTFWNSGDGRFVVPTFFGAGWTLNLRSAPRHPVQAALVVAFLFWRIRPRRGR